MTDAYGRPAAYAQVSTGGAQGTARTLANASGEYEFTRLPAGRFTLGAIYGPYGARAYGQSPDNPRGIEIALQDGQQLQGVDVAFVGSMITGVVWDEYGEPADGATVVARPVASGAGAGPGGLLATPSTTVDDRGAYRLFAPPGVYHVTASFNTGTFTTFFHPGATAPAEAVAVDTRSGRDAFGIDIAMFSALRFPLRGSVVDRHQPGCGRRSTARPSLVMSVSGAR